MIDLRSDTFTKPTGEMRKAMYQAEVGDDVYGEDPTVNKLEEMAEQITGKEKALVVSSGCMGNLIPMMIKGGRGMEIICARESHIVQHEIGAIASISGTLPVYAESDNGILSPDSVKEKIHGYAYDMSETSMIEVENTTSGLIYPIDTLKSIKAISEEHGLWTHLDGARIFNASVETGYSVKDYASACDDITFCLSKGLGAPAFSILASSAEFIEKAKRIRKILGGGMRQIGIIAAAGIYALENNVERLKEDHIHRRMISDALSQTDWAEVIISSTNMIFFKCSVPVDKVIDKFKSLGILFLADGGMARIVTNLNVSDDDTAAVVKTIQSLSEKDFA